MRIGLFLSRDDGAISEAVDVQGLAVKYAHLAASRVYESFFRFADQQDILKTVQEEGLEAVVLAGNSPQYFETAFGGGEILAALKGKGLNENRFCLVNLKEQVALPHAGEKSQATEKAQLLIDVALAKVKVSPKIKSTTIAPARSVMVVGTSAGGIVAAKELVDKGYRVFLVEQGTAIRALAEHGADILPAFSAVQSNPKVKIFFQSMVTDVSGYCGKYQVVLTTPTGPEEMLVGGVILTTGNDLDWMRTLRSKLRFTTDQDGHPAQEMTMPGQTADPGVWFISSASGGNRFAAELSGASLAVLSLTTILDRNEIDHPLLITAVNDKVCGGCGTCVKTCAFSASAIDLARKLSVIDPERCKGCGNCVTACPTGARDLVTMPRAYVTRAVDILSRGVSGSADPKVLAVLCKKCGYTALDAAGRDIAAGAAPYPANVTPLFIECGGSVDSQYVLEAFSKGFDGVALFVCKDGHCRNIVGNTDMQRRLGLFRAILRSRRIEDDRLSVVPVACHDGETIRDELAFFYDRLRELAADAIGGSEIG